MASSFCSAFDRYVYISAKANNGIARTETVRSEIYDIVESGFYDIEYASYHALLLCDALSRSVIRYARWLRRFVLLLIGIFIFV